MPKPRPCWQRVTNRPARGMSWHGLWPAVADIEASKQQAKNAGQKGGRCAAGALLQWEPSASGGLCSLCCCWIRCDLQMRNARKPKIPTGTRRVGWGPTWARPGRPGIRSGAEKSMQVASAAPPGPLLCEPCSPVGQAAKVGPPRPARQSQTALQQKSPRREPPDPDQQRASKPALRACKRPTSHFLVPASHWRARKSVKMSAMQLVICNESRDHASSCSFQDRLGPSTMAK